MTPNQKVLEHLKNHPDVYISITGLRVKNLFKILLFWNHAIRSKRQADGRILKVADLVNSPESGNGGAITAALFLKEFVKKTKKWMHFDLMAWNNRERAGRPVGGEAMAMRAVYAYLKKKYS
jgi:leucyl aminopeptidase